MYLSQKPIVNVLKADELETDAMEYTPDHDEPIQKSTV
jgi:hypothetical protein